MQTGPTYYDDNVGRGTLTRLVIDTKVGLSGVLCSALDVP